MNPVAGTSAATVPVETADPVASASGSDAGSSVLPAPDAGLGGDPLSVLSYLESKSETTGVAASTKRIEGLQQQRTQAVEDEQKAAEAMAQAAQHKSFWDDLGSVLGTVAQAAAVVASVAAAVATCGAASPLAAVAIAGAVLSTAGFADGQLHVLKSLGVDDKTAGLLDAGMSVGGSVMSLGSGVLAGGVSTARTADVVTRAAAVAAGAATVGQGAAAIESGLAQQALDQEGADDVADQGTRDQAMRMVQTTIDAMGADDRAFAAYQSTLAGTQKTLDATGLALAGAAKG